MSGAAVGLMLVGTITEQTWLTGWALLISVFAVALGLTAAVERAAETVKVYVRKWSHQAFEDGFKGGVEAGREMEAAERFVREVRDT